MTTPTIDLDKLTLELKEWSNPPTITTAGDYIKAVLRNEIIPAHLQIIPEAPAWHWRWLHGAIGTASEQGEVRAQLIPPGGNYLRFDRVNLIEELGDRFWYHVLKLVALFPTADSVTWGDWQLKATLDISVVAANQPSIEALILQMADTDAKLMDLAKRLLIYSKKPDTASLIAASYQSFAVTVSIAATAGIPVPLILQTNTNKLWARKADAVQKKLQMGDMNRNLANERAVMEKSISTPSA